MERKQLLIDTSILIDYLRKPQKDRTLLYRVSSQFDCVITVITEFEFVVGSTPKNQEFVKELLQKLPVISFDTECVKNATNIYRHLKLTNQLTPLPDLFISAIAITHNLPLLTLNQKHFERVRNLILYDPSVVI